MFVLSVNVRDWVGRIEDKGFLFKIAGFYSPKIDEKDKAKVSVIKSWPWKIENTKKIKVQQNWTSDLSKLT